MRVRVDSLCSVLIRFCESDDLSLEFCHNYSFIIDLVTKFLGKISFLGRVSLLNFLASKFVLVEFHVNWFMWAEAPFYQRLLMTLDRCIGFATRKRNWIQVLFKKLLYNEERTGNSLPGLARATSR